MPPLTLTNAPIDPTHYPHRIFSMSPLTLFNTPIGSFHWKCPTPRLKCFNTSKPNWIHPNGYAPQFDWIRPLPPPKALNRRHWGFTSVQAVSWKTYATISTNSTKPQPNQNRKIATSPHKDKGKYVELFSLQRRAIFPHLNFKKWSAHEVFCTFWLENVLLATAACNFSTSELQKVVRECCVLYILTWKCASRYSGVQFFISPINSYLRTRRFTEVTFRPSRPTNHWKTQHFATSLTFRACGSSFYWLSRNCVFFSSDSTSLLCFFIFWLCCSALLFQLSILSEVRLLNFLRLETNEFIQKSFNSIRSKIHKIYSINSTKVSLSNYENKRYWTNSVDSLACGHYKIHDFRNEQYMLF